VGVIADGGAQPFLPGLGDPALEGLLYRPAFLSAGEERDLLAELARLEWGEFRMHGVVARRRVVFFGHDYAPDRREITRTEAALPPWLIALRERAAALAGEPPERLEQVLAAMYPPGAGVGWHRDAPPFGEVVGVSLGSGCRMRFRLAADQSGRPARAAATWDTWLEPGSAYVLAGAARWRWRHTVPPVKTLRYSVTFRTVRAPSEVRRPSRPPPADAP
jgi:alkylated DNA repair dioxygenase AlkB